MNDRMEVLLQDFLVNRKRFCLLDSQPHVSDYAGMPRPRKKGKMRPLWAERLTALRTLTGKSQTDFAAKIGVSQQRYGGWETGKAQPDVEHWIKISDELGQTVDFIMRGPNPLADRQTHQAA